MGLQYGSCCWFPSEISNSKLSKIQSYSWLITCICLRCKSFWIQYSASARNDLNSQNSCCLLNNMNIDPFRATIRNDFSNSIVFVSTFKIAFFWHFPPLVCSWFLWLVWRIKLLLYRRKRKLRKYVIKNLHEWKDDATNHLWLA